MTMFTYLKEYKLQEELFEGNGIEKTMKYPHHFYTPYPEDIPKALATFDPFPFELKVFYEQIGFGFMHRRKGKINRVLDPISLILVNLRQDECKYDKALEKTLSIYDINKQLLFFQSSAGEYAVIDRVATNGSNPVFYRQNKLADSLAEFVACVHKDEYWIDYALDSTRTGNDRRTEDADKKKTLNEIYNAKPDEMYLVEGSYRIID